MTFHSVHPQGKVGCLKVEKKMSGERNGEGGKRWKSRVNPGRCLLFILHFSQTSGPFLQHGAAKPFSRTEGLGHDFGFEMASSLLLEMGWSANVLDALPTGMHTWRGSKLEMAWGCVS